MPEPDGLPPELARARDRDPQDPTGFFGGRFTVKAVAWVVIAAMFLVPGLLQLLGAISRI